MFSQTLRRLLSPGAQHPTSRYALVDCAGTQEDKTLYSRINSDDVQKHHLFTGEMVCSSDQAAPLLLPLEIQPNLERWLLENAWQGNWGIFFTSSADIKTLLKHFRQYLNLQTPDGHDIFFRFYDAIVLHDFLSTLSKSEAISFFGPVQRYLLRDTQGEPKVFDKPEGKHSKIINPSNLVLGVERQDRISKHWRAELLEQHADKYREFGLAVSADTVANALTLEDREGVIVKLQKTVACVTATTGEQRQYKYDLTTCMHPAAVTDPAENRIDFDIQTHANIDKRNTIPIVNAIRMEDDQKTWVFDYNDLNRLARVDYPDGTCTKLYTDSHGNLTGVVDRNGNATQYEYDYEERLTQCEDSNGHATQFDYQDLTAPSNINFADGTSFGFEYTEADALEKFLVGNTLVASYQVDKESGCWTVEYKDGGHAEFVVEAGKIVRAINASGTVELAYNESGHLIRETFRNRSVTYHRNETGQLTGITTPFGQTIRYTLDGENRTCGIKAWSGKKIAIQYALNGTLESITFPNRTRLEQKTNALGWPSQMHLRGPEGTLFHKKFQRDQLNRITQIKAGEQQTRYNYDKQGRLIEVLYDHGDITETFELDAKANRLCDHNSSYTINESDRIIEADNAPFHYDDLGNLVQGRCPAGTADFTLTDLNRLDSISLSRGRAQYLYDAFGRRVAKKFNGITTRFYWAQSQLLHEVQINPNDDSEATGITDYLWFPETPVLLAIRQNRQSRWAAFGHRYEVLCLSDDGGNIVWQAQYDAFGKARVEVGETLHQPFRLVGQYYDQESGLHYNLSRYYDPSQGRYLSPNPLFSEGGSDNLYVYCSGDPINNISPRGETFFSVPLIGTALGAVIGATVENIRCRRSGEERDGFAIVKMALAGGILDAIGKGTGLNAEAMSSSVFPAMVNIGFLSGTDASMDEPCAEAEMTGNGFDPFIMVQKALADGVIGFGGAQESFEASGFITRKLIKSSEAYRPASPTERSVKRGQQSKEGKSKASDLAKKKGRQARDKLRLCGAVGSVIPVTGEVQLSQSDFILPWRIPMAWNRSYSSHSRYSGYLGSGWQGPADARLEIDTDEMVVFYDGRSGGVIFEKLPVDEPIMEVTDGAIMTASQEHFQVMLKSGLRYRFSKTFLKNQTLVERISDACGNYIVFYRKAEHGLVKISNNSGQCIDIICNKGRMEQMQLGNHVLLNYRYNEDRLVAAIDARGLKKRFYYQDARLVRHMDNNQHAYNFEYDDSGRCTRSWVDDGIYERRFEYHPYDRSVVVTDSLSYLKTYYYNKDRLPTKVQDHNGAAVIYAYDEVGRTKSVMDPLERITEYDYDAAGNVIEIIRPDSNHMVFIYDDNHRLRQRLDANGKLWEQRFDQMGRLIETITPLDEHIHYGYNRNGDLVTRIDDLSHVTTFECDDHGQVSAIIDGQNNITRYQHDLLGNLSTIIDPEGGVIRYVYDKTSRLIQTVQRSGNEDRFAWDGEDNLVLYTNPSDLQTRYEYVRDNKVVRCINADGTTVSYQYDTEENLISVTNEKGQVQQFSYDHAGRKIAHTDAFGHTMRYTYDAAGQIILSRDPLDRTVTYDHDPAGRLLTKTFESEDQEVFNWDANGNLTAIQSADVLVERFYDAANHMIAEKKGAFVVEYQYDGNGRRIGRTTSHGNHVQYSYNAMGTLSIIQINDLAPITMERNSLGQITREYFSEYLERTYAYTQEGFLGHQSINSASGTVERRYEYDASGNLIVKHDSNVGSWQFSYDPVGRVTEAIDPDRKVCRYDYDPGGDLLEHLPDTGRSLRSARYNQIEYRFDALGNLAERQQKNDLTRFTWDEQNRMTIARQADDTRITMAYDALGRRHIKATNGERTFFNYDGNALLSEQFEDLAALEYVYYPGTCEPLAVIHGDGQVYYYHNDVNGMPLEMTIPNGEVVWSGTHDALGRVEKIQVDEVAQPLRMRGQYYDLEIDLCYYKHRYFEPRICAFISKGPLGVPFTKSMYAHVPDIWDWTDPLEVGVEADFSAVDAIRLDPFQGRNPSPVWPRNSC